LRIAPPRPGGAIRAAPTNHFRKNLNMNFDIPDVSLDELTATDNLAALIGADEAKRVAAEIRAMERMTPDERIEQALRGKLRGRALRAWAASRPHELENTTLAVDEDGPDGMPFVPCNHDGEYPWILHRSVDYGDTPSSRTWRIDGRTVSREDYEDHLR
jgi:hypothetical protein